RLRPDRAHPLRPHPVRPAGDPGDGAVATRGPRARHRRRRQRLHRQGRVRPARPAGRHPPAGAGSTRMNGPHHPVRVLVVGDSGAMRMLLVDLLEASPGIRVAATVDGGQAALDFLAGTPVDVILVDARMRHMDGYETTRRIMETRPVPVVMCSTPSDPDSVASAFRAYEAGAVAVVERPVAPDHASHRRLADALLQTVRLMSEVKVVRRGPHRATPAGRAER